MATKPQDNSNEAIEAMQAQIAALVAQLGGKQPVSADFSEQIATAEGNGAVKVEVVPGLQKGASPALRVDH